MEGLFPKPLKSIAEDLNLKPDPILKKEPPNPEDAKPAGDVKEEEKCKPGEACPKNDKNIFKPETAKGVEGIFGKPTLVAKKEKKKPVSGPKQVDKKKYDPKGKKAGPGGYDPCAAYKGKKDKPAFCK